MEKSPCPSYPGYSVTRNGRVFTHRRRFGLGKGNGGGVCIDSAYCKELNTYIGHGNYFYVAVVTTRGRRSVPIHTLLMDAFVGPKPEGMEVRHLDGNPHNLQLGNLAYGTRRENSNDRMAHGKQARGENHGRAKLNNAEVRSIRRLRQEGLTFAAIAERIGCSESVARDIAHGRRWTHVE